MKTRTNISAVVSVLSVVALAGSVFAAEPSKVVTPVSSEKPQVRTGAETEVPPKYNPDYNRSGTVDTQDIFDYLTGWFANKADCDVDYSGYLDGLDILNYINIWFSAGIPAK